MVTLSELQLRFVTEYLRNGGNASAAAVSAGYSHGSSGRRLLRSDKIGKAIEVERSKTVATSGAELQGRGKKIPAARRTFRRLAEVSGERIVDELADVAFSEPPEPPTHSEKLRALDILAKVQGLYNENPVFVQVKQYVQSLPPDERRELLLNRGRLIELLEGQGYTIEAAS